MNKSRMRERITKRVKSRQGQTDRKIERHAEK